MASPHIGITGGNTVDPTAGLLNRASLISCLEHLLLRGQSNSFALLLIHIGNLQAMMDGFSGLIVNEVLRTLSFRLKRVIESFPDSCRAARIGSDKFAVLLSEHADEAAAIKLAAQIREEVEQPFAWRSRQVSMRISVGIRLGMKRNAKAEEVLWDADTALSQAEKSGKTPCAVFESSMREQAIRRLALEGELRQAIKQKEFVLHYQPKVSLHSRKLAGFEALVRWNHPQRGLIAPGEFIPVAEETGLILRLGEWVLEEACCQLSKWRRQIPQAEALSMSVNLSSRQLIGENLVDHVKHCLRQYGIRAKTLHLEVTETSVLESTDLVLRTMERLRDLKVNLCIDDFGTGHSSLGYLHRFPFRTLKIDRSFIARMEQRNTLAIIRAILSLSHALGMDVVAEGIETPEQADQLAQLRCDYGQGYFFSKPVEADTAASMILAGKFPHAGNSKSRIVRLGGCLSPSRIPAIQSIPAVG